MPSRLTRRRFLAAAATAPLWARSARGTRIQPRVAVVGAGAFGGWTAWWLQRAGAEVTLVDARGPGNPLASSGGESRVIRAVYGPDRIYTEMVRRSYELWEALEAETPEPIHVPTGALWMLRGDDAYVRSSLPVTSELGFPVDEMATDEAAKRWPQVNFAGVRRVFFERRAGVLAANAACARVRDRFVAAGGTYRDGRVRRPELGSGRVVSLSLEDGSRVEADRFVFACGPWLGQLFPEVIGNRVQPTRQEVHYFGVPDGSTEFAPGAMPVWIEFGERIVYGLPTAFGHGFKIADDTRGEPCDPETMDRTATPESVERARTDLGRLFPRLADAPLLESRVCQYENSPEGDLILDRHPGARDAWIVGGGSGHGYKLGPAVGELVSDVVLAAVEPPERFRLGSRGATPEKTQFDAGR